MAPAEMVRHNHSFTSETSDLDLLSIGYPIPPNSPILPPASLLSATRKNIIKKAQAFIATLGSSRPDTLPKTPPESPETHAAASPQHLQQLHQKLIEAQPSGSDAPDSAIFNVQGGIQSKNTVIEKPKEYKIFNEVYVAIAYV